MARLYPSEHVRRGRNMRFDVRRYKHAGRRAYAGNTALSARRSGYNGGGVFVRTGVQRVAENGCVGLLAFAAQSDGAGVRAVLFDVDGAQLCRAVR